LPTTREVVYMKMRIFCLQHIERRVNILEESMITIISKKQSF